MSIKFTGPSRIRTATLANWPGNFAQWSYSILFRYDGTPASAADYIAQTDYSSYYLYFDGAGANGTVKLSFLMSDNSRNPSSKDNVLLSPGGVYHLAMTYQSGTQTAYVNGVPIAMSPSLTAGLLYTSQRSYLGGLGGDFQKIFTVSDQAMWGGYVLTSDDIAALRDGTATPATIGGGASFRAYWPLSTPGKTAGDLVTVGDSGLADYFGNASIKFQTIEGGGIVAYSDTLKVTPVVTANAVVSTSGTSLHVFFTRNSDGQATPITGYYADPTIKINGGTPLDLSTVPSVKRSDITGILYFLPSGTAVTSANDLLTLSAPALWVNTEAGIAPAMTNQIALNCYNKSFIGTDALTKTLRMGVNMPWSGVPNYGLYVIPKNLRYRAGNSYGISGRDASGRPNKLSGTRGSVVLHGLNATNGIDSTGTPGPVGYYAVKWTDTGDHANHPTTLSLSSYDSNYTVTEVTSLANPGTTVPGVGQVGIVRVFNVQRGVTTDQTMTLQLLIDYPNANGAGDPYTPSFTDDYVWGPSDFTYTAGVPATLETSDPYAVSATAVDRLNNIGSIRCMDTLLPFGDYSNICEPEHLQPISDWAWQGGTINRTVGCTQMRPWSVATTPYVYSGIFGSSYTATLGADIVTAPAAGTIETITVSDAGAAPTAVSGPVMAGQTLTIGSEILRILSVSGTTVTVERGACSTTPATHTAGAIQVNYRYQLSSIADWGASHGQQVVEFVTNGRHGFESLQVTPSSSGWPTVTFTDGFTWNYGSSANPAFVTGPNTLVSAFGGFDSNPSTNVTLGSTYNLDPAVCYFSMRIPEGAHFPYEFQARMAAQIPGEPSLHIVLPIAASDSLADYVARVMLAHLPAGRKLYVELQNEPWNPNFTCSAMFAQLDYWFYKGRDSYPARKGWQTRRTSQIARRFYDRFNEVGRGSEIRAVLNMATWDYDSMPTVLNQITTENLKIDEIASAPYWETPGDVVDVVKTLNAVTIEQLIDFNSYLMKWNSDPNSLLGLTAYQTGMGYKAYIDAYNQTHGTDMKVYMYEGGPGLIIPVIHTTLNGAINNSTTTITVADGSKLSAGMYLLLEPNSDYTIGSSSEWVYVQNVSTNTLTVLRGQGGTSARSHADGVKVRNWEIEASRDMVHHPQFRIVEQDYYGMLQLGGFETANLYAYAMDYYGYHQQWGVYHLIDQPYGIGDGSDGKANNLLTLARPGQAHTKSTTTNHESSQVSVRGWALKDWNSPASNGGGGGGGGDGVSGKLVRFLIVRYSKT